MGPARVAIDGRVREHQRELELRDRATEVIERDRPTGLYLRRHVREKLAVLRAAVQTSQDFAAYVGVSAGEMESSDFDSLGGRNERLCREQMRQVRQAGSFRRGKDEPLLLSNGSPDGALKREFHMSVG